MTASSLPERPDAGPRRFWHGVHNPASESKPLIIELREQTTSNGAHLPKFSRLIGKRSCIADEVAVVEAMRDILVVASHVDEYTGILPTGGKWA